MHVADGVVSVGVIVFCQEVSDSPIDMIKWLYSSFYEKKCFSISGRLEAFSLDAMKQTCRDTKMEYSRNWEKVMGEPDPILNRELIRLRLFPFASLISISSRVSLEVWFQFNNSLPNPRIFGERRQIWSLHNLLTPPNLSLKNWKASAEVFLALL
ncbi:uncharacterized protein LOC130796203 [Actinidia eriantha]|uniref:uncharacterized protein LOC130796203 n=1 Tax=Actinidia eriantha TaxID=165200 RepID=UPI002590031D|nr:uncharacterized protein LOC130796203 [Actinidia eriantha]